MEGLVDTGQSRFVIGWPLAPLKGQVTLETTASPCCTDTGSSRSGEALAAQDLLPCQGGHPPQGSAKVICQCLPGEEPSLPLLEEIN